MEKEIIDACCGSKMFWFNHNHPKTIYMDIRELEDTPCDGRKLIIKPDIVGDYTDIPFPDNTFKLAVFDPPHLNHGGGSSWMVKKYGKLEKDWQPQIKKGLNECMRVLELGGILVFKWNEEQIKFKDIVPLCDYKPLFGDRRQKTLWLVYMKI